MATRSEPPVRQAANQADLPAKADTATAASDAGSASAAGSAAGPPVGLRVAAAAQGAEAIVLFVAAVFAAVGTADGKSYERASGIALTLIAVGTAAGLGAFAAGLARARAWTRTPVVMTQLFVGGAGIYLVDGHRLEWGIPTLALAAICLAGIFAPASLRALNRSPLDAPAPPPDPTPEPQPAKPAKTSQNTNTSQSTKAQQNAKTGQNAKTSQNAKTQQNAKPAKAQQNAKTSQNAKRPPANRKRKPNR